MKARQTDIPFERDQSTRFLPWIVAVMVFLAGLATSFTIVVSDAIDSWDSTLTGQITIQVPGEDTALSQRRAGSRRMVSTRAAAPPSSGAPGTSSCRKAL